MSDETKRHVQFGLACVGAASLVGTIATALYHATKQAVGYWTAGEIEAE